jgi:hypothetical protein
MITKTDSVSEFSAELISDETSDQIGQDLTSTGGSSPPGLVLCRDDVCSRLGKALLSKVFAESRHT